MSDTIPDIIISIAQSFVSGVGWKCQELGWGEEARIALLVSLLIPQYVLGPSLCPEDFVYLINRLLVQVISAIAGSSYVYVCNADSSP